MQTYLFLQASQILVREYSRVDIIFALVHLPARYPEREAARHLRSFHSGEHFLRGRIATGSEEIGTAEC